MKNNYPTPERPHNIKAGDIFEMSWGYDQTNVNYFQVTRTSPKGVWVREIGAQSVPGTQGFMCETVTPNLNAFLERSQWCGGFNAGNPETFRRLQFSTYAAKNTGEISWYFNFDGRYFARKVADDSTTYNSWYA